MAIGRGVQAAADDTGDRNATIGTNNIRWATQLIALHAIPGPADVYNQNDVDQWIPVKFTGLDNDSPAVTNREAYVDANNIPRPSTDIVHAIGCFDVSQVGTNLATPLDQARQYLAAHGREHASRASSRGSSSRPTASRSTTTARRAWATGGPGRRAPTAPGRPTPSRPPASSCS